MPTRFDRRKEDILNAAAELINKLGLRDATLAVVASEIGLHLKSLRHYFPRREDLVSAAFLRSIALHRELAEQAMAAGDPEKRVRSFIAAYFAMRARVVRGEQPHFVHFGDLRALASPHREAVGAEYTQMFRAIRNLLRTPELDRMTLNARTHMLLSQLLWSVVWLRSYLPGDYVRAGERFADVLINGIASRPVDLHRRALPPPALPPEGERLNQESFLRATTESINAQGYRGASVDRISSLLNVTKGAFYHHNDSRDALVVACFDRTFGFIQSAQDAAMASDLDNMSRVSAAAAALVTRQMSPEGVLLRTSALTAVGPDIRIQLSDRMSMFTRRFADMLNDGIVDGSVRPCDMRIASEMVTAMINSAEEIGRWVPGFDPAQVTGLGVQPLLYGLGEAWSG